MKYWLVILLCIPVLGICQASKEVVLPSKILGEDRKIWINTPEGYSLRQDSLHLILLLDGNNKSMLDLTVAARRFLEQNSVDLSDFNAPQSIVVGIQQAGDRWKDFGDSAGARKFLEFLVNELLPYVEANYRTLNYRILIGHSLGGYFAMNVLLERPELFNAVIAASPAFSHNDIARTLDRFQGFLNAKLPFDRALYFCTTYMAGDGTEEQFREFSETLGQYLEKHQVSNFRFQFNKIARMGHGKSPFVAIPEGLRFIYSPSLWQLPADSLFAKNSTAAVAVKRYQAGIKSRFGISVSTQRFAGILSEELLKAGKLKEAVDLLKAEITKNPTDLDLFAQLLIQMKKKKDVEFPIYEKKLVEVFNSLHIPAAEQKEWYNYINDNSH